MDFSFLNNVNPDLISITKLDSQNMINSKKNYGLRVVENYEFDYIIWGKGKMLINDYSYPAVRGSLFFRRPGMVVDGYLPYHCYFVKLNIFSDHIFYNIPKDFPVVINFENKDTIENLFSILYHEYITQKDISNFITRKTIMDIFHFIYKEYKMKEEKNLSNQFSYNKIMDTVTFINDNIESNFTLEELADKSGYSKYSFCRLFKKYTGETPITYVNKSKINTAKKMLLESNKSVKEILLSCGFQNESHFFSLFQKIVGSTPSEFRRHGQF